METRMRSTGYSSGKAGSRTGSALVMALASVSVVALMATTFIQFVSQVSNSQAGAVDRKKAFYLAEAGLTEGFAGVVCGRSGEVGSEGAPARLGDGLFWVESEELAGEKVELTSVGMSGRARAQLSIVVQKGTHTLLDMGFFSTDDLTVEPGVTVDSYDSSEGEYDSSTAGRARLISNKAVLISGTADEPTLINGDVVAGPKDGVETSGRVTISGQELVSPLEVEVPTLPTPQVEYERAVVVDSPYPYVASPMVAGLEALTVKADSEVTLQGPSVLVVRDLLIEPGATLNFDGSGGAIFLYIEESLDLQAGSTVTTTTSDPTRSIVFVNQEDRGAAALRSDAQFHGVVYAPNTALSISESFEVFGSVGAHKLVLEGPVKLHFDHVLVEFAQELRRPRLDSWKIDELALPPGKGSDPFSRMGLDRANLKAPGLAREDQELDVTYLDAAGEARTYSGPESGFDWADAEVLVGGERDGEPLVVPGEDTYYEVNDRASKALGKGGIEPLGGKRLRAWTWKALRPFKRERRRSLRWGSL